MNRRAFLKATGAAALAAAVPGGCRESARPYNLLFVMADQWRFSALGKGSGLATPNIDRMAAEGLRCNRAYVANPVCAPSRGSIMTGRLPHEHGVIVNLLTLPPTERGIAESFVDSGYRTHYIGKWHLDGVSRPGFVPAGWRRHGFETFEGFNRGHWYNRPRTFTNEGKLIRPETSEFAYQTDRAIDFVKRHSSDPFFCFLSWGPPHPASSGVHPNERFAKEQPRWRGNVPYGARKLRSLKTRLGEYYDLCEQLDRELGRLLGAVEDAGLSEKTVVVFTSDHGDMLGSHGMMFKDHPYEESIRVPLLVRQPGRIRAGSETDVLVSNIDLMPSLTGLCGLRAPGGCTGRDLSRALLGLGEEAVESIYCQGRMDGSDAVGKQLGTGAWRAVVTKRYKLVVDATETDVLLTNLEEDPLELENLVGSSEHSAVSEALHAELDDWRSLTVDPFPRPPISAERSYTNPLEPV